MTAKTKLTVFGPSGAFNSRHLLRSFLTPTKHSLHPRGKLASDAVEVVDAIAHLAPFEVFDPEGTMLDLEFVDPELRIMGVALGSKRGSNSLHVFRRLDEGGFLDDE